VEAAEHLQGCETVAIGTKNAQIAAAYFGRAVTAAGRRSLVKQQERLAVLGFPATVRGLLCTISQAAGHNYLVMVGLTLIRDATTFLRTWKVHRAKYRKMRRSFVLTRSSGHRAHGQATQEYFQLLPMTHLYN
jgi:hypothetical protein